MIADAKDGQMGIGCVVNYSKLHLILHRRRGVLVDGVGRAWQA
jgi:hypothetical protein